MPSHYPPTARTAIGLTCRKWPGRVFSYADDSFWKKNGHFPDVDIHKFAIEYVVSSQSTAAIRAGNKGFNVNVAGKTDLIGGQITSTQKAVDDNKNSFNNNTPEGLARLTVTNLANAATYSATGSSVTVGIGSELASSGAGAGRATGNANSTTEAAITGVAGNKTARTGDFEAGLQPIFNLEAVKLDVATQIEITKKFGQNAGKAVGDFAAEQLKKAQDSGDQAEIDKWKEGGISRVALHTLVGALGGGVGGAVGAATSQTVIPLLGEQIAQLDIPVELKQVLVQVAAVAVGAATGGTAGVAAAVNATGQNYLTSTDIRSRDQKIKGCQANGDAQCEIRVLREYDLKNATNSAGINYKSVLSEGALKSEKAALEQLLQDPKISPNAKALAQQSIKELEVAINVIQKSPVLRDAAELGLIIADVATLGALAGAKVLGSAMVQQFIKAKTGKEIGEIEAARIANNFYAEGSATQQALATSSGMVIRVTEGKTTTVLGSYKDDMKNIIESQIGLGRQSITHLEPKPSSFNILNVPNDYAASISKQGADAFWNQVNKPFLDAAITRGDDIYLATKPTESVLSRTLPDGTIIRSGYGREYDYLQASGYSYNSLTGKMSRGVR
jgi:hypothetical protein